MNFITSRAWKPFRWGLGACALIGASVPASAIPGGVNPAYITAKIYEVRFSQSPDCSNGVVIFRNDAAQSVDLVGNPSLGSGSLPNGTYHCVMLRMSDTLHHSPASSDGMLCSPGTDYTHDFFHSGDTEDAYTPELVNLGPGQDVEQVMWLYWSTAGNDSNSGEHPQQAMRLPASFTVRNDQQATFVFNADGGIITAGGLCRVEELVMSVR